MTYLKKLVLDESTKSLLSKVKAIDKDIRKFTTLLSWLKAEELRPIIVTWAMELTQVDYDEAMGAITMYIRVLSTHSNAQA